MRHNTYRPEMDSWKALESLAKTHQKTHINDLFDRDQQRFETFHIEIDKLIFDFSKQRICNQTVAALCSYAQECNIEEWQEKMFSGEKINTTEDRAVLHTALRAPKTQSVMVDGNNVMPEIHQTLDKMRDLTDSIHENRRFKHVINIGIGGSDLGAYMAYEALKPFTNRDMTFDFVSNIDAAHLLESLQNIDPNNVLFIVASKSFTTEETLTNARTARRWLQEKLGTEHVGEQFVAVTENVSEAKAFGIDEQQIFPIWDWVGGRYSIWSAVGLPLCIALGFEKFRDMLDGAHFMDEHFKNTPCEQNIPMMMALIGIWNRNFLGYESLAVIPYAQYLHRFPAYLQQLDMESNGKAVDRNDENIEYDTGPVIFGEPGTNAQHAFFQLIHQSNTIIPCEFIASAKSQHDHPDHQAKLLAHVLAQSKALMEGREHDNPHKVFTGNRPNSTLLLEELTPYTLGMLIALYEHKVFAQGVLWNINSFDQCGVELGKILAKDVITLLNNEDQKTTDSSTKGLISKIKQLSA